MQFDFTEHRRHFRVYFKGDGEFTCTVDPSGSGLFTAKVLDLSLGGIHLAMDGRHDFEVGNRLCLKNFFHRNSVPVKENVEIEVRWVFRSQDFKNIYIGCQFQSLSSSLYAYFAQLIGEKVEEKKMAALRENN